MANLGRGRARAFTVAADYPFAGVLRDLFAAEVERARALFQALRKVLDDYDVLVCLDVRKRCARRGRTRK